MGITDIECLRVKFAFIIEMEAFLFSSFRHELIAYALKT